VARGFLSGVLWGGLVSFGVVATVSVLSTGPQSPQVMETAPKAGSADLAQDSGAAIQSGTDSATIAESTLPGVAPQVADQSPDMSALTDPGTVPEVKLETSGLESATIPDATDVVVQGDTPVQTAPQATAPQVPNTEADVAVSTQTAAAPAIPQVPEPATPDVEVAAVPLPTPEPVAPAPTATAPQPAVPTPAAPEQQPDAESTTPDSNVAALPDVPDNASTGIGTPATDLSKLAPNVATNRLPTLADDPNTDADAGTSDTGALLFDADLPPIQRYAVPFENPDAKPLMAIVLMDDGTGIAIGTAGPEALRSFPYPITFAVDTRLPNAAEKMKQYRSDGFEVMALVNLPEISTAADTEVSMSVALNAVPEAVAILEGTDTGIQGNREMANQVAAILLDTGQGLVTQPNGLNTVQKLASRSGVPAATLFRDFDGKGQSSDTIRRFLDQAAFKAAQEGGVIMVGRLRPDTISALTLWGLQDRAGRVALAPVSAVLTAP
jgi:polysaccharide deacetylase 2 family uncharacterized protein YibQ